MAIADPAVTAGVESALQFAPERHELRDAPVDILDVTAGDAIDLCARTLRLLAERQQFTNSGDLKP
jgi:hypothetical protein